MLVPDCTFKVSANIIIFVYLVIEKEEEEEHITGSNNEIENKNLMQGVSPLTAPPCGQKYGLLDSDLTRTFHYGRGVGH